MSSNASYGYGYNGYAYGYGYSYGYGYGNNLGASKLTYKIIVNTTNFSMGANWFSLSVNDGTPTDDQKIVVRPVQAQSHTRSNVDNVASGLLLAGYTSTMRSNEILSFKLNGEAHTLKLLGIKNNQVNIVVSSTPQYATLSEGQSKEFDLDEDGVKDLLVSVLKIDSSTADIKIQKIEKAVLTASVLQNPNEVKPNNPVNPPVTNTPGRAKGKLAGITGAFIGTLGTGGSIATVVIILLVVIGLIILVRRKKASSQ